jgi:hypothetical protein
MKSAPNLTAAFAVLLLVVLSACQGPTGPRFPDPTGPKEGDEGDQSFNQFRVPALAWQGAATSTAGLSVLESRLSTMAEGT